MNLVQLRARVDAGEVPVSVDPAPHQSFSVTTEHFDVRVLGTVFEVGLEEPLGSPSSMLRNGMARTTSPARISRRKSSWSNVGYIRITRSRDSSSNKSGRLLDRAFVFALGGCRRNFHFPDCERRQKYLALLHRTFFLWRHCNNFYGVANAFCGYARFKALVLYFTHSVGDNSGAGCFYDGEELEETLSIKIKL